MPLEALAALIAAGIVAGFVAGLFGVGGGVVMVPVLRFLADALGWPPDQAMHFAVATSTAAVLPTAISSARAHYRHGNVDMDIVRRWAPPMALAAIAAATVAPYISTVGLTLVFAVFAAIVGLRMAASADWRWRETLPGAGVQRLLAALVGWLSSWMGIGAGTLGVPTLVAVGAPIHRAVGTAALLGVFVSAPALIGWLASARHAPAVAGPAVGYIQLLPLAAMLLPMVLLAPLGARIAKSLPPSNLRRIFGLFLICVSVALLDRAMR
ncbi:sulfite exporter TauE/SafE family protein [Sphingoaurantiacus capsulatus]|uniref:Probable membrane transporter protein n=1 Tax=Sphingoaurantiacus capsulatus TaxID=1771310 RepID=A0ABV7X8L5_9SPHN